MVFSKQSIYFFNLQSNKKNEELVTETIMYPEGEADITCGLVLRLSAIQQYLRAYSDDSIMVLVVGHVDGTVYAI